MQRFALKSNFSLLRQRSEMQTRWDSRKIVTSHQMFFFKAIFFLDVSFVIGKAPYYLAMAVNVNVCDSVTPNDFSF